MIFTFARVAVVLALMTHLSATGKAINNLVGPYIIYTERFYMCEPANCQYPWRWHLRGSHFNPQRPRELQRLTGNLTGVNVTVDNSCNVQMYIDAWSNNQWKENWFVFNFKGNDACQKIKQNIPGFWEIFFKKTETKGACILEPGVYSVDNSPIDWTFANVPVFPYGHYRFRLTGGNAGKIYTCLTVDLRVIPKLAYA